MSFNVILLGFSIFKLLSISNGIYYFKLINLRLIDDRFLVISQLVEESDL